MKYSSIIHNLNFKTFCKLNKIESGVESIKYFEHLIKDLIETCMSMPVIVKNGSKVSKIKERILLSPRSLEKALLFLTIQRLQRLNGGGLVNSS